MKPNAMLDAIRKRRDAIQAEMAELGRRFAADHAALSGAKGELDRILGFQELVDKSAKPRLTRQIFGKVEKDILHYMPPLGVAITEAVEIIRKHTGHPVGSIRSGLKSLKRKGAIATNGDMYVAVAKETSEPAAEVEDAAE